MKQCTKCKQHKDESDFHKASRRKDGLQTACKECKLKHNRAYYKRNKKRMSEQIQTAKKQRITDNRQKLLEYLQEHPCLHCGNEDIRVLEFDHIRDKEENVTFLVQEGYSWDRIKREIKKCQVLCANCHRIKTFKGSYRDT